MIFDAHFSGVRNYIYYRSGDQDLATDIAQETFLRFWEKMPDLANGNIKALLFKMAGDLFISHIRKQKVVAKYTARTMDNQFGDTPHEVLQHKELLRSYELALQRLPEKQRTVFLMSRMDGLKYTEIADHTGLSLKAVEKRMKNALEFLKKAILN